MNPQSTFYLAELLQIIFPLIPPALAVVALISARTAFRTKPIQIAFFSSLIWLAFMTTRVVFESPLGPFPVAQDYILGDDSHEQLQLQWTLIGICQVFVFISNSALFVSLWYFFRHQILATMTNEAPPKLHE